MLKAAMPGLGPCWGSMVRVRMPGGPGRGHLPCWPTANSLAVLAQEQACIHLAVSCNQTGWGHDTEQMSLLRKLGPPGTMPPES